MPQRWYKGNTHTHTSYSDGDSPPEVVVDWYAEHGYDFLFLTDHNILIPEDHLARLQRGKLAVWQGEEVTMAAVHVNGLGLRQLISPSQPGKSNQEHTVTESRAERVRWAIDRIHAQEGVAHVNHPNYLWALGIDVLMEAGDIEMIEVANGHNLVANPGDDTHLSTEAIWDAMLTAGRRTWGVASDDAHHFTRWGDDWANPGRGWLQVEADSERLSDCLDALRQGRFYGSSGLELSAYSGTPREVRLELATGPAHIELIGPGGHVLDAIEGDSAHFTLTDAVGAYARVRASASDGRQLWTQPIFR
ncbi:MAG: PHP domain-containing protein [Chloroflexi bacterium]|nr:PHP domain-containing protein [Chloroflexota bacterium]